MAPTTIGTACASDAECPAATGPCMVATCADGGCQLQVATAGTVPASQIAGDCQELICDGRGATVPRENLGDTPADDANECTEETCSAAGPEHAPLAAGAKCAEAGVCNGKGRCGVCLPEVRRCERNAAQTCSGEGEWSAPALCEAGTPICAKGRCAGVEAMALGDAHRCFTLDQGAIACAWVTESPQSVGSPKPVAGLFHVVALALGSSHRCALQDDRTARCWGNNLAGELGDGTREGRAAPAAVVGVEGATRIAAGDAHTCALVAKGAVICWGRDDKGQLGGAGAAAPPNPTVHAMKRLQPSARGTVFMVVPSYLQAIAVGGDATCALNRDSSVECWGAPSILAAPSIPGKKVAPPPKPQIVAGLKGATAIALGGDHSCALLQDGSATCWGDNEKGQLGDGSAAKKHPPAKVKGLAGVVELALGRDHTCARLADGTVQCWGSNAAGQLGDGSTTDRKVPGPVPGLAGVASIAAAGQRTCARLESGAALCWGDDADGAIHGAKPIPTAVTW